MESDTELATKLYRNDVSFRMAVDTFVSLMKTSDFSIQRLNLATHYAHILLSRSVVGSSLEADDTGPPHLNTQDK